MSEKYTLNSKIGFLYLFMSVCMCSLLVYFGITHNNEVIQTRNNRGYQVLSDIEFNNITDSSAPAGIRKEYSLSLEDIAEGDNSLIFYVVHHYVQIYLDQELVYSLLPDEDCKVSANVGCNWVEVPLYPEDSGKEIKIIATPVYKSVADRSLEIFLGSKYSILMSRIVDDLLDIIISIAAIGIGIIFIGIALFLTIQKSKDESLIYLGLFSVFVGIWKITDIRSAPIMFPKNPLLLSQISLAMLSMAVPPFVIFIKKQFGGKWNKLLNLSCFVSTAVALFQILLQITGQADLRESLWVTHVIIALTGILVLWIVGNEWIGRKTSKKVVITLICFFLCVVSSVADMLLYYIKGSSYRILNTILVFFIYIISMGIISIRELNYRASIDFATGLFNRSRCRELILNGNVIEESLCLIMFDLNSLKYVNDTMGHEAGDDMICSFADVLRHNVPSNAFIGRYGGDEFMVVMNRCDVEAVEKVLTDIARAVEKHNASKARIKLSYSVGCAMSEQYPGCTMGFLMEKADKNMYEDKKDYYKGLRSKVSDSAGSI